MWNDFKNMLNDINFGRIFNIFKETMKKVNLCNDGISKISCLIEGVMEIFE